MAITDKQYLKWPPKLMSKGSKRDRSKYCQYHKDHEHDTDECCHLTEEIENLIKRGHLREFVGKKDRPAERESSGKTPDRSALHSPKLKIKEALGPLRQDRRHTQGKRPKTNQTISFSNVHLEGVLLPHNDVMVIGTIISDLLVKKVLVDNGSSADILYYHAFKQMGIPEERLKPFVSHSYGFSGNMVQVKGSIELPVWIGSAPHTTTLRR
ncbi:uncharacterized protein LOC143855400 [Tasmannia lanceolata]|uniref:uncharacterized protein LOC143855400 n=1 Tax=Tasmannia lanceolata TaxID=3420 RepID=UPI004063772B